MPELPEIEAYRSLAERVVGRRITAVVAPDPWYVKGVDARELRDALVGRRVTAARRIGKLLLLDTDGATLGLRFGMTGRLIVDGVPGVDALQYASNADEPAWDRFGLRFGRGSPGRGSRVEGSLGRGSRVEGSLSRGSPAGGSLVIRDPRRLGGVSLDPAEARLGADARGITTAQLRAALARSAAPLKARLLDQSRVAGIGNLLADEVLWRAGLDPARPAGGLGDREVQRFARAIRGTIEDLIARGGSHLGDLGPERHPGGLCPRDGAALQRRRIGGRTTWSCPHQV